MSIYILILASIVQLIGAGLYIRSMITGSTKPNRVPWFLVAFAAFVATGVAVYEGVRWAVLPGFMSGFGPFCIFVASFVIPEAYWKSTKFDYFCGFLSLLGVMLWLGMDKGALALIAAISSDFLATVPLLIKAWKFPETESSVEFLTTFFAATVGLFVIQSWRFVEWGFLVYLVVISSVLVFAVERKRF